MPAYLVDYDLNSPGQDYSKLTSKIKEFNGHFKILKSSWFVYDTTKSAVDVYNALASSIDKNDRIFVTQVTSNNHGWLGKEAWEWLEKALKLP